jgi:PRTRC genetic system protein E
MFRDLHNLARLCTGLTVGIVAEDEYRLRVTVQPIAGDKAPIITGMVLTGTPEELDDGFTDAIETYQAPVASLLEQAQAAAAAVGKGKATPKALPAPKAAPAKAEKPAKDKPAKRTTPAPTKPAPPDEPTPPNAEAQGPEAETPGPVAPQSEAHQDKTSPEASAPRVKLRTTPAKPTDGETEAVNAQDRLACIADMRAYLAGNAASDKPVKPSRADYLNKYKPTTGRRYERLFASFDELVAAAQQQALPEVGEPAPHVEAPPPGELNQTSGTDANCAAPEPAVVASAPDTAVPQQAWPPVSTTDDGKPAHVALKDLQAPPADATDTLFKGASGFSLDLI